MDTMTVCGIHGGCRGEGGCARTTGGTYGGTAAIATMICGKRWRTSLQPRLWPAMSLGTLIQGNHRPLTFQKGKGSASARGASSTVVGMDDADRSIATPARSPLFSPVPGADTTPPSAGTWLSRLRSELRACAAAGMLRSAQARASGPRRFRGSPFGRAVAAFSESPRIRSICMRPASDDHCFRTAHLPFRFACHRARRLACSTPTPRMQAAQAFTPGSVLVSTLRSHRAITHSRAGFLRRRPRREPPPPPFPPPPPPPRLDPLLL